MPSWTEIALAAARVARRELRLDPAASPVAVILGSGLSAFADHLEEAVSLPFTELPGFPPATVQGHRGRLASGRIGPVPVLALQGRLHGYEGHDAATVAFPARVLGVLGARALVVTNAAGGIGPDLRPGDLMRIADHINLTGKNPLAGPNEEALGPRFPDVSRAYDPRLADALEEAARAAGQRLRVGVYLMMTGPSYETPAEIRMARALGADAVGMSTVPEILAAAHMGLPACGISCITNFAAGISAVPLTHAEVVEVAHAAFGRFTALLGELIPRAFEAVPPRRALL